MTAAAAASAGAALAVRHVGGRGQGDSGRRPCPRVPGIGGSGRGAKAMTARGLPSAASESTAAAAAAAAARTKLVAGTAAAGGRAGCGPGVLPATDFESRRIKFAASASENRPSREHRPSRSCKRAEETLSRDHKCSWCAAHQLHPPPAALSGRGGLRLRGANCDT